MFEVGFYDEKVLEIYQSFSVDIRAKFQRLFSLLELYGNEVKEPHSKFIGQGLFELRVKGKDNIAILFYAFQKDKKIYLLHGFIKKSQKTPKNELEIAYKKLKELNDE